MADGKMIINPTEARAKAMRMQEIARQLEELLNTVSAEINKIDDIDEGIYQGNKKPAELRAELNEFRSKFSLTYNQIIKSANDIINIATVKENA